MCPKVRALLLKPGEGLAVAPADEAMDNRKGQAE
jgi:hypothetical protein